MLKFAPGQRRRADVYVGGVLLTSVDAASDTSSLRTVKVDVPSELMGRETLEVKLVCPEGAFVTPRFYEVRLLKL